MLRTKKPLRNKAVEELEEWKEEILRSEQAKGFLVQAELSPSPHFKELLQSSEAAWHRDERVG